MGKELKAVFQKTLLGIERAQGDRDVLDELLDSQLVADVLGLPEREVPEEVRVFFKEWQEKSQELNKKSESVESTELPDDASVEQVKNYLDEAKSLVDDLRKFKVWLVSSAPVRVPNEIVSAAQNVLNGVISESEEQLQQVQGMIDFAKAISPEDDNSQTVKKPV